jgi:hypothetical protein
MELKQIEVGKIIKFNGIRLIVTKAVQGCRGCYFKAKEKCHAESVGVCSPPWRKVNVIFRKYDENKKENLHSRSTRVLKAAKRKMGL